MGKWQDFDFSKAELIEAEVATHPAGPLRCAHMTTKEGKQLKALGANDMEAIQNVLEKAYKDYEVLIPPLLHVKDKEGPVH